MSKLLKILLHYPNLLNDLLQFGSGSPLEQLDRLWDLLKSSNLDVYISQRGLAIIEGDVEAIGGGPQVAQQVSERLRRVFRICPSTDLQQARNFARQYAGSNYEEALELHSAYSIGIDYILSSVPYAFYSFRLEEILLSHTLSLALDRRQAVAPLLPGLIKGELADLWFLINARGAANLPPPRLSQQRRDQTLPQLLPPPLGATTMTALSSGASLNSLQRSRPTYLGKWFQSGDFGYGWQSLHALDVCPYSEPAFRSRRVSRGKVLPLGLVNQPDINSVALIISVGNPTRDFHVTVELVPAQREVLLPNNLKCKILDATGTCVAVEEADNSPAIVMQIEGEKAEPFSILIQHQGCEHRENFVL